MMCTSANEKAWSCIRLNGNPFGNTAETYATFAFHRTQCKFIGMSKPNSVSAVAVTVALKVSTNGNSVTFPYADNNDGNILGQMIVKELMG